METARGSGESSAMAAKATGIESIHEVGPGESYKASDGLEGVGGGSGSMEMRGENVVDEAVLEQGIEALEGRGKKWYAYLMTRDFWLVLVIGYFPLLLLLLSSFSISHI